MTAVLVLCLLINFAQAPQETQPQEGRDHLLGKVATVRTEVAKFTEAGGEWVEGKRILSRVESYDTEGRKTSREDFTEDGDRIGKLTFTYDAAGRLVESESYIGSERRGVPVKHYKSVHKYGDGGFEDERLDYLDGRLDARTVYTYSTTAKDKRTEMVSYTASGAIMSRTVYAYDAQGNQAEIVSYGPDGTVREKIVSSFDAGNRRTKTAHYDGAGTLVREEVFDEKGEVVESTSAESKAPGKYDSRYDARGNMIETDYYDTNGKLRYKVSVEYEYDGEGNWTKRALSDCTYLADRTVCRRLGVTYRTFTYHEAGKR
jgi:YD repeat-containing protein